MACVFRSRALGVAARGVTLDQEQLAVLGARARAVGELAGQVQAVADRGLALDLLDGRAARLAGARRGDDARDDGLADAGVVEQPVLERVADGGLDRGGDLGVVEPVLRLPLELRVADVDAQQRDHALANVLRGDGHALRVDALRLHEAADGAVQRRLQPRLVRAARARRDAVGVGEQPLLGRLGPRQRQLDARVVVVLVEHERLGRDGPLAALLHQVTEVLDDAAGVMELDALAGLLVLEDDLEPLVQVALGLEPLLHDVDVVGELLAEDLGVRPEVDRGAALATRRANLLDLALGLPARVDLLVVLLVAEDVGRHLHAERVDDRGADAVQAAAHRVVLVAEFPARVQRGEDQLEGRLLVLLVDVDRDAAAVVDDGRAPVVLVEVDLDGVGVPVDGLVDRVVDDLPEQVVIAVLRRVPDVHRGALTHRLEALEDGDLLRRVTSHRLTPLRSARARPARVGPVARASRA